MLRKPVEKFQRSVILRVAKGSRSGIPRWVAQFKEETTGLGKLLRYRLVFRGRHHLSCSPGNVYISQTLMFVCL